VALGYLSKALALASVTFDSSVVQFERSAADVAAFEPGTPHAGAHPLDDQAALEFCDGAHDDDGSTQRASGVDALLERDELDVEPAQFVEHCEEMI
jgi:hypothetical protein